MRPMIPPLMPCLPKPFQNDGPAVAAPVGRSPTAFNPDVESLISVHVTVLPSTLLEPEWLITLPGNVTETLKAPTLILSSRASSKNFLPIDSDTLSASKVNPNPAPRASSAVVVIVNLQPTYSLSSTNSAFTPCCFSEADTSNVLSQSEKSEGFFPASSRSALETPYTNVERT